MVGVTGSIAVAPTMMVQSAAIASEVQPNKAFIYSVVAPLSAAVAAAILRTPCAIANSNSSRRVTQLVIDHPLASVGSLVPGG